MNTESPKVVFGLPAHNGERHLAEAIESLLCQTDRDFALLVLDDCSTDGTGDVALRYVAFDPRVVYERNADRLGLVGTWRRAVELAALRYPDAPYFAWASDHDIWHPRWLERLSEELESDPDAVLVYPNGAAIMDKGDPFPRRPKRFDSTGVVEPRQRVLATIAGASAGWAAYGLFRAQTLRRCGIYRAVILPDRLLMAEISLHGHIRMVDHPLWFRRYRTGEVASHARQRRTLFAGERPPLYSYLPWWAMHGAALFWSLAVRRRGHAPVGRREGFVIAVQYTTHAWRFASKDHGLIRQWERAKHGWTKGGHRFNRLVWWRVKQARIVRSVRNWKKTARRWWRTPTRFVGRQAKRSRRTIRSAKRQVLRAGLYALRIAKIRNARPPGR